MTDNHLTKGKGVFTAAVCTNRQVKERFYRLGLEFSGAAAEAFAKTKPGQFAQLDLCGAALPKNEMIPKDLADASHRQILLRRPFSFCDVVAKAGKTTAEILYRAVGPASMRMTALKTGDSLGIIGPLGNGFFVPPSKKNAILAAGGMGAGPLLHLARVLTASYPSINVIVFVGAKTATELPFDMHRDEISKQLGFSLVEFTKLGIESHLATDDGSAGFAGLVTDCLAEWIGQNPPSAKDTIIYSCGPEPMLAKVTQIAKGRNIDCQISMERMMACGIGVCQSCVVECKAGTPDQTIYKLCCKDGPVFDAKEVIF